MSSINGLGFVGPEDFETSEILAVETDLTVSSVQTDTFPGARKHTSTTYIEHTPKGQRSGSCGVRNKTTVAAERSWAPSTDTHDALVCITGVWVRRRETPNPGVDAFRPTGKL